VAYEKSPAAWAGRREGGDVREENVRWRSVADITAKPTTKISVTSARNRGEEAAAGKPKKRQRKTVMKKRRK